MKNLYNYLESIDDVLKKTICFVILFSCVLSSVQTAYDSHMSFYQKTPNEDFVRVLGKIAGYPPYNLFLSYTGLNTGYGFFSPNVSSDFIITQNIYIKGKETVILSNSHFKTKEGASRFANLNSLFMDKIEIMEKPKISSDDSMRIKYLEVILKRLNNYVLDHNKDIDSVNTTLFLHHFPFLSQYPNTKQDFIKIENHKKNSKRYL